MSQLWQSNNPMLNNRSFTQASTSAADQNTMTLQGTASKTIGLLVMVVAAGAWTWYLLTQSANPGSAIPWAIGGAIVALITALITCFAPSWAMVTAPLYAAGEGLLMGAISAMLDKIYPGIAIQAASLTVGILLVMLLLYKVGLVRATEKFKMGLLAATGAVAIFYLVMMVMGFFGSRPDFFYGNGLLSIGITGVIVVIASLNLVLDFAFIEEGAEKGLPKHMEWYAAFGLLVTLIWIYMEVLRLLSKLRSRD